MTCSLAVRIACALAILAGPLAARAESLASSASSAGSESSGSVSDSLHGSSHSSTGGDKTAAGDYRVVELAQAADRAGIVRLTLQAQDPQQRIVLDLPQRIADAQRLGTGDLVHVERRVYGLEFARGAAREVFYLVLDDQWFAGLAARPVRL